jgi:predicted transcriptional regulator
VLKLMQIMAEKGLVARDESARTHVYSAKVGEEQTQRHLAGDLMERAFGGSAKKLMVAALSGRRATRQELAEIRRLIDDMERGAK